MGIQVTENHLPHWEQPGCVYFLTFRLVDSLPQTMLRDWKEDRERWERWNPPPWDKSQEREFHDRFPAHREQWLDAGHGACLLAQPKLRKAVEEALASQIPCVIPWSWVLMPNHFHGLCSVGAGEALSALVKTWKGRSARALNLARGARGPVWAKDYFDRLVRNREHFARCVRYIRRNPQKAGLQGHEFTLWESEYVQTEIQD